MQREKPDTIAAAELGLLKGVYHVKMSFRYVAPFVALDAFAAIIILGNLATGTVFEHIMLGVIGLIFVLPIAYGNWVFIRGLRDELSIYTGGFTYKSHKGLQHCTWKQIKDEGGVVDLDKRIKLTSVTKKNGEKIVFAPNMLGRDVLDQALNHIQYDELPDEIKAGPEDLVPADPKPLGDLKGVFHTSKLWSIFLIGFLAFPISFVVLGALGSQGWWGIGCAGAAVLFLIVCSVTLFRDRRDELTVYENGFTYKCRKGLQTCTWDEIVDYDLSSKGDLEGIKKADGEYFDFAVTLNGLDLLKPHLKATYKVLPPEK